MNTIKDRPGVLIASPMEVKEMEDTELQEKKSIDEQINESMRQSSIAAHITKVFQENKDARINAGIEKKMLESLRAYNGHYDPEDIANIRQQGGSEIYMNITANKVKAAISWLKDIFQPANGRPWSLEPTPIPNVPVEISDMIREGIEQHVDKIKPKAEGQVGPTVAAQTMMEQNNLQQDVEDAIMDEIYRVASNEVKKFESKIEDDLIEGGWEKALSDFIADFCTFPVAIMKGPIISKKNRLTWQNGEPVQITDYIFKNERVSPLDIYPSASATEICDGNLCEHVRFTRKDLYDLIGVPKYKEENIKKVLENSENSGLSSFLDTYIEDEKVTEEYRGDQYRANQGIIHGVHYFGSASYKELSDWGYDPAELGEDTEAQYEVEAILAGTEVIKCVINKDPLLRRPYYKASMFPIPGSWWGRSLPEMMRDDQRMCNASARALANNMGLASGPQIEVYLDRLAADEEIDNIYPFKIWQLTSDPTGAGGRAVQFWQPTSNATELLGVYQHFENKADEVTGIPKYAHGNEKTGSAPQTATGLSILYEASSKTIKEAARQIDLGLIQPRIEYQFYWNMISSEDNKFTGDIVVVPEGSSTLTAKGTQELRRNEFLGLLANQAFQQIIGVEGLAEILREMAKSLGLGTNIIPSRVELRKRQAEAAQAEAQRQQAEAQAKSEEQAVGIQQVQMQTQQAERASQRKAQIDAAKLQSDAESKERDRQLKLHEIDRKVQVEGGKQMTDLQKQQMVEAGKAESDNKSIALSVSSGYRDKSNVT